MFKFLVKIRDRISTLLAMFYQKTNWEPLIPPTLESLKNFMMDYYEYEADPLWGMLDHIQPIKHMNWQLQVNNFIKGDCDDHAFYSCYMLERMEYNEIYLVNIPKHLHVICVFKAKDGFRYISNEYMSLVSYSTWKEAAQGWCKIHGLPSDVKFVEQSFINGGLRS